MDKIDKKAVGKRISMIRRNLGLTMEEFGKKVDNASKSNVSKWENGSSLPNNNRIKIIAKLGGLSVADILQGNQDIPIHDLMFINSFSNSEEIFEKLDQDRKNDYAFMFESFTSLILRSIEKDDIERFDKFANLINRLNDFDKSVDDWTSFDNSFSMILLSFNDYVETQKIALDILNDSFSNYMKIYNDFHN